MRFHREGFLIMGVATGIILFLVTFTFLFIPSNLIFLRYGISILLCFLFLLIIQFFRVPNRVIAGTNNDVVCPADGKVVVIEEVFEPEFLQQKCIQISIFMSPLNVHANYIPIQGKVQYTKYHEGKYLVAWHPKSSTENERSTVVIETENGKQILVRQIAGAMARRICFYAVEGMEYNKGDEFGFIKFGSRVDVFLPLESKIKVEIGQIVKNRQDILATL